MKSKPHHISSQALADMIAKTATECEAYRDSAVVLEGLTLTLAAYFKAKRPGFDAKRFRHRANPRIGS